MDQDTSTSVPTTVAKPAPTIVIWAVVFRPSYKAKVRGRTTKEIYQERKSARKGKAKAEDDAGDSKDSGDEEPSKYNQDGTLKRIAGVDIDEDDIVIIFPDGTEVEGSGKGTYQFMMKVGDTQPEGASKAKAKKPEAPRVSVATDMEWVAITQTAQPYPSDIDEREGVKQHAVGPAKKSPLLTCNPDLDIFVFDRAVLSAIQRPENTEKGGEKYPVNVFKALDKKRAQSGRNVVENFLLRPKHVALNINDPGSILLYYDLIIRASQTSREGIRELFEDGPRTVTFFSGPEMCNHQDCNEWRNRHKGMRTPGALEIQGYKWWMFANICLRDPSTLSFQDGPHVKDVIATLNLNPDVIRHIRTWSHALLNHNPVNGELTDEGLPQTALRVVVLRGLPGLLIDNCGCMTAERVKDNDQLDLVRTHIDPDVGVCAFCKQRGFGIGHFSLAPLPKAVIGGIMFLHYQKVDEDEEETDAPKGKEKVNGTASAAPASPKGKGKAGRATRSRGKGASSSKGKGKDANATEDEDEEARIPKAKRARARANKDKDKEEEATSSKGKGKETKTPKRKRADTDTDDEEEESSSPQGNGAEPTTPKGKRRQSKTPRSKSEHD
ncbi:hypothetical protein F4776DRAFT_673429 [Hypoxylon sp. NC0597]|nr:hypothetical protein F4776DRAFT_673429 [Hypoxylon sp. NC0597]